MIIIRKTIFDLQEINGDTDLFVDKQENNIVSKV